MKSKAHCIIMAGGSGTRFWPLSRKRLPKQLLKLTDNKTLIEHTIDRVSPLFQQKDVHIVTGETIKSELKKVLRKYKHVNYVFEPSGRNTAPCIGYMAMKIAHQFTPKDVLVIMPADHLIDDKHSFNKVISAGIKACTEKNQLVTIGIKPKGPHTGYGYIKMGRVDSTYNKVGIYKVSSFKEKPDAKTAKIFLKNGNYLWNSGIFIAQAGFLIDAIKDKMPELYRGLRKISASFGTKKEDRVFKDLFSKLPAESIDYGVIEKLPPPMVIPADFGWNDLGSWISLQEVLKPKEFGISNSEKIVTINSTGNIVHTTDNKKIIALLGVKDLIVVETPDAILIANKNDDQKIKQLVDKIKQKGLDKHI